MPTEFINAIKATGGDYTTIPLWESGTNCDLTVAGTKVFAHGGITGTVGDNAAVTGQDSSATGTVVNCTDTQILIELISGTFQADEEVRVTVGNSVTISDAGDSAIVVGELYNETYTARTTLNGTTTDSTNFRRLTTNSAHYHGGDPTAGSIINPSDSGRQFVVFEDNFEFTWLNIKDTSGSSGNGINIDANSLSVYIANCVFSDTSDGAIESNNDSLTVTVENCFFQDCNKNGVHIATACNNSTWNIYNCTAVNCTQNDTLNIYGALGFQDDGSNSGTTANIENCYAHAEDSGVKDYPDPTAGTLNLTKCMSSDTTGNTGLQNKAPADIVVTATLGSEDLHLKTGSNDAIDAGNNLTSTLKIDEDIDNVTRPTAGDWDIGADWRDDSPSGGRIMSSLAGSGGLAHWGGIAGRGGGLAG